MRPIRGYLPALLFLLPFLVRAAYFLETRDEPYVQWNFLVAYVNHTFAVDLAQDHRAPYALYRSPFYPWLVSWIYRIAGIDPLAVRLLQWLLGGAGCLLVYFLGKGLLGDVKQARAALLMAALFVPAVYFEGELLEQSCTTFFVLAGVTLLARAGPGGSGSAMCLAGSIVYGLGVLMRPDAILSAPFLVLALGLGPDSGPRKARRAGAFAAVCALALLLLSYPGAVLDVRENNTSINAAINLYIGNNAQADGHRAINPDTPELPTNDPSALADHMTGLDLAGVRHARERTGGGLDTVAPYWLSRARAFIAGDPAAWARLMGRKFLLFFNGHLPATQKDLYFLRASSWLLGAFLWCAGICFPLGLILPLAMVGAASPRAARARLFLLGVPLGCLLTTLIFFHDVRFQLPAAPFLILLAASGLFAVRDAARRRRLAAPALLIAGLIFSNADWLGTHVTNRAPEEFRVGTMHLEAGELAQAQTAYRRSIEADPSFVPSLDNYLHCVTLTGDREAAIVFLDGLSVSRRATPPLVRALASLHGAAGRADRALETLRAGAAKFPDDIALALDLAELLMRGGGEGEALDLARRALAASAGEPRACAIAGYCLMALGRPDEAIATLQEGLGGRPADATLLGLLGQAYGRLGRRGEEQRCYREVLQRDPRHLLATYELSRSLASEARYDEALTYARQAERLGHPDAAALVRDLESRRRR